MSTEIDETILIEYLDDELPNESRQAVEERLKTEPELKRQLTELRQTREFLNLLDKEEALPDLVATTMRIVAVSQQQKQNWYRISRKYYPPLAAVLIVAAAFFAGTFFAPKDDPFFFSSIQRLDMYLAVLDEEQDFLWLLTERKLFLPDEPVEEPQNSQTPQSEFVWNDRFNNNLKRFWGSSPEKRKRVRVLHNKIELAQQRTELVLTLQNYYHWCKSLQSYEKAELRKRCSVSEKVEKIAALKTQLDSQISGTVLLSGLVDFAEEQRLAEKLKTLQMREKEQLLNEPPESIIERLK
ncbi:hypothetical protein FACS189443_5350 [Planctomycetales bacterium]|nr:hypothetical protein FACS189443_5350 [Planctomycetales bacterium]